MLNYYNKFKFILSYSKQFNFAVVLVFMMLIGAILETLSIAMIFPLVDSLVSSETSSSIKFFSNLLIKLQLDLTDDIINFLILIIILVFICKNLFLVFLSYLNVRFIYNLQTFISNILFEYYLKHDLEFHNYNHSSNLIRNTKGEVERFGSVIKITLNFTIELLVIFSILIFLLFFSFTPTVIIFLTLFTIIFLYYLVFKKILLDWGKKRQKFDSRIIKLIQDGLGALQELKILNREDEIIKKFTKNILILFSIQKNLNFLNTFPKVLIEIIAVIFFCVFIFISLNTGSEIKQIIPIIAVFAAVAFRLMPSFIRVLNLIQQIRYEIPAIDIIYSEIIKLNDRNNYKFTNNQNIDSYEFKNTIIFQNVSYKYPGAEKYLFKNLSFEINNYDFFGIFGRSGVGKSTIISMLIGLIQPNAGSIKIDGKELSGNLKNWYKKIGYVPQKIFLIDDTLLHNIAFGVPDDEINLNKIKKCINICELDELVRGLPYGLNSKIGENGVRISGGQRQRIGIARALYINPQVLVFDEATNEIDSKTENKIMQNLLLLKPKKTFLIVSHKKDTITKCNKIINLDDYAI